MLKNCKIKQGKVKKNKREGNLENKERKKRGREKKWGFVRGKGQEKTA